MAPQSLGSASLILRWGGGGKAGKGEHAGGNTPQWLFSLTFTPGATAPLLTHRSQILPPHLPPPQAEALLHPGGEDSLIKVFRNAGGWGLKRGGCNLENWFSVCLSPLASGTCRGAMGPLGKQGDSQELELPKGCLFLGQHPHTRTPPQNTMRCFPALFTKNVFCIPAFLRGGILLSLSPRSLVFQKERI